MISVNTVVMETTRRCNMKCEHCLRGEPQNKSMSRQHIVDFFRQIDCIGDIVFTGGEPTLPSGLKVIEDFLSYWRTRTCELNIGSFYIATNGKVWRPELPGIVAELYNYCSDNEISSVHISSDQWHDNVPDQRKYFKHKLNEELYYLIGRPEFVSDRGEIEQRYILEEGRGTQFATGRTFKPEDIEVSNYRGVSLHGDGEIYLNCNGNVINGCDWSYESQEDPDNIICKASDDLEEVFFQYGQLQEAA